VSKVSANNQSKNAKKAELTGFVRNSIMMSESSVIDGVDPKAMY
jgi:hypothetical protein